MHAPLPRPLELPVETERKQPLRIRQGHPSPDARLRPDAVTARVPDGQEPVLLLSRTEGSRRARVTCAMPQNADRPLSKIELRRALNVVARSRFGTPADRIPARITSGSTGESADARRIAAMARYAKK